MTEKSQRSKLTNAYTDLCAVSDAATAPPIELGQFGNYSYAKSMQEGIVANQVELALI